MSTSIIGALYFDHLDEPGFFEVVRSSTPTGQPIKVISTRRPFDDPGNDGLYYRIRPIVTSTLVKRHMPYALSPERLSRWQALFLEPDYEVAELPSYEPVAAANPFKTFSALPIGARYEFMLEEAQFTIMGFIKGPVLSRPGGHQRYRGSLLGHVY